MILFFHFVGMSYCKISHVLAYKGGTGTFLDIAVLVSFRADSPLECMKWNGTKPSWY